MVKETFSYLRDKVEYGHQTTHLRVYDHKAGNHDND